MGTDTPSVEALAAELEKRSRAFSSSDYPHLVADMRRAAAALLSLATERDGLRAALEATVAERDAIAAMLKSVTPEF